jgi:asparagine synthase (glutamine-hydrolysing)
VPGEILDRRDKVGFATPQLAWLHGARGELESYLLAGDVLRRGWVGQAEVRRLFDRLASGRRTHEQLWRVVVLEAWLAELDQLGRTAARAHPAPRVVRSPRRVKRNRVAVP